MKKSLTMLFCFMTLTRFLSFNDIQLDVVLYIGDVVCLSILLHVFLEHVFDIFLSSRERFFAYTTSTILLASLFQLLYIVLSVSLLCCSPYCVVS